MHLILFDKQAFFETQKQMLSSFVGKYRMIEALISYLQPKDTFLVTSHKSAQEIFPHSNLIPFRDTIVQTVSKILEQINEDGMILVFDLTRPHLGSHVDKLLACMDRNIYDAIVPVVKVSGVIKYLYENRAEVAFTLDNSLLRWAVSPEILRTKVIRQAVSSALLQGIDSHDLSSLIERIGGRVGTLEVSKQELVLPNCHMEVEDGCYG